MIQVEVPAPEGSANPIQKVEYRSWNPFRSKLAAAILGGVDSIHMGPGKKVNILALCSEFTILNLGLVFGCSQWNYSVTCF